MGRKKESFQAWVCGEHTPEPGRCAILMRKCQPGEVVLHNVTRNEYRIISGAEFRRLYAFTS